MIRSNSARNYYEVGIRARRTAHTLLTEVPELYDEVEDRIDALLARTLGLLEQHTVDDSSATGDTEQVGIVTR
ncbi:hypothetical protein [Rhodococcus sp. 1168]|uniref:hypothetical protein n=1 Tax=Rhodococcus sp. 1168 TaxID=2018041 RepID=UPI000A0DA7CE|nr:hypothetical protein [Rhodococcus sp. 1168]ORI21259.1 hypothetical protein BJI47_17735 [Rhodococcus sp. 1168]